MGALLFAAAIILLYPLAKKYTPLCKPLCGISTGNPGASMTAGAIPGAIAAAVLLLICILSAWHTVLTIPTGSRNMSGRLFPKRVLSVETGRYGDRALVADENTSVDPKGILAVSLLHVPRGVRLRAGDRIHIDAPPHPITSQTASSPFTLNLLRRGIGTVYYPKAAEVWFIEKAGPDAKTSIRKSLEKAIDVTFDRNTGQVLKSLYFGNKHFMDKQTLMRFRNAGVMHVLAASGLHIGIVAAVPFLLLAPLRINKKVIIFAGLLAAAFYLYITDVPVSLLRAFIMFTIFALLRTFDAENNPQNSLFISALVILSIYPHELYGMGFQLSFGATLGILLFYSSFHSLMGSTPAIVKNAVSLTLSAQVLVLPVIFLHLREVNLAGVFSNLLVVPAISFTLVASLVTLAVSTLSPALAAIAGHITDGACTLSTLCAEYTADLGLHYTVSGSGITLALPYLLYISPLLPLKLSLHVKRVLLVSSFALSLLMLSHGRSSPAEWSRLRTAQSDIIMHARQRHALVYGSLGSIDDARRLLGHIADAGIETLQVCIPVPDYNNLRFYGYVVRNAVVKRCSLGTGYRFSGVFTGLMEIIDRDHIKLEIRDLPPLVPCKEMTANEIKKICVSLFRPPDMRRNRLTALPGYFFKTVFKDPAPESRDQVVPESAKSSFVDEDDVPFI